jgi:hypothetical protein
MVASPTAQPNHRRLLAGHSLLLVAAASPGRLAGSTVQGAVEADPRQLAGLILRSAAEAHHLVKWPPGQAPTE